MEKVSNWVLLVAITAVSIGFISYAYSCTQI